jgi:hypothetical protein
MPAISRSSRAASGQSGVSARTHRLATLLQTSLIPEVRANYLPDRKPIPDSQKFQERGRPGLALVEVTPTPPSRLVQTARSACSTDCHAPARKVNSQRPFALRLSAPFATSVEGSRLRCQIQPLAEGLAFRLAAESRQRQRVSSSVRTIADGVRTWNDVEVSGQLAGVGSGHPALGGVGRACSSAGRVDPTQLGLYVEKAGMLTGRPASGSPDRGSGLLACGSAAGSGRRA